MAESRNGWYPVVWTDKFASDPHVLFQFSKLMTNEMDERPGDQLVEALTSVLGTRYEFTSKLGAGAFGEVYCLYDTTLERNVAVKRVRLDVFSDAEQRNEVRERTIREAKVAAKLKHSHIVTIYDVVDRPDMSFIIMEYIEGRTLGRVLKDQGRLSINDTIRILGQAASALDFAHAKGVVHRDIKPANIMVEASSGDVKVMDFGIAKSDAYTEITAAGSVLGTPNYMPPEQARGESNIGHRADLFSLGCVLYECLVGQKAFAGKSVMSTLMSIINEEPRSFDPETIGLQPTVADLFERALAKSPDERFATGGEMIEALRSLPQIDNAPTVFTAPALPTDAPVVTLREPGNTSSFDARLQGALSDTTVAELIREVYVSRNSGILHFERDGVAKRIYFKKGNVVFANSDINDDRLGEFLIRTGHIDRATFDRAAELMGQTRKRMGTTLITLEVMSRAKVEELVRRQVEEIIYSVFEWGSGAYGFEILERPVEEDIGVELSTAELILIGVRRMGTLDRVLKTLGRLDRVLRHTENPLLLYQKLTLTPAEGYVLSRVDGATSVAEIAAMSPLGEDGTLRCVYALMAAGVVEVASKASPSTSRVNTTQTETHVPPPDLRSEEALEDEASAGDEPRSTSTEADETAKAILDDVAAKHASLETSDLYQVLEVSPGATDLEIKKGYYAMARKYHPDRHHLPHLRAIHGLLEELFRKITDAYEALSDPAARRRYDGERHQKARVTKQEQDPKSPVPVAAWSSTVPPEVVAERHYQKGYIHLENMEYFDAIQCLRESVRILPGEPRYHRLLARALSKNPNWRKQAEAHYQEALKANEFDIECLLGLAENYEAAGLTTRAARLYEKVIVYDPDNVAAQEKLQGVQGGKGKKRSRRKG